MTAQGLSRLAGGIALVAVLVVAGLVTWSYVNQTDPEFVSTQAGGSAMGDVTGYVGKVDREARTLDVSESLLGLRPMVLTVTNESSIMVRGKQGALGDLAKDMPVRVYYEVRNDVRYVTSLQVMTAETQTAQTAPGDARPAVAPAAPAAEPKAAESRPAPDVKPVPESRPAVASKPIESNPPVEAKPAPAPARPTPPPVATPAPAPRPAPAAPSEAASIAARPAPPVARPAPVDSDDGTAAVDWLLNSRR